jgi:hypothetical protein
MRVTKLEPITNDAVGAHVYEGPNRWLRGAALPPPTKPPRLRARSIALTLTLLALLMAAMSTLYFARGPVAILLEKREPDGFLEQDVSEMARRDQLQVRRLELEIAELRGRMGTTAAPTIAPSEVTALQRQLDDMKRQFTEREAAHERQIDRLYQQNLWFIGIMFTLVLGVLTLIVSNVMRRE